MSDRRATLADAGIRLVAGGGVRALTHRAVDTEAGVPAGSTSYYARSRRELTRLVVERITEQLAVDLDRAALPADLDLEGATAFVEGFVATLSARHEAQTARLAFLTDLRVDDELRLTLTAADPVRAALVETARQLLGALGAADPDTAAVDLVGLCDALVLYRAAQVAPLDAHRVLHAHLAGLVRG